MSSIMGNKIKISVFGQSHSEAIGCVIDGLPSGIKLDMNKINKFMQRRAPGRSSVSTSRTEPDTPQILSGVVDNITCGAPLAMIIENTNIHSKDYSDIKINPRPGHSDYPYFVKTNGKNDIRGGGHSSGRLTAPICFAGAVALQILDSMGINVTAHIYSVADEYDTPFNPITVTDIDVAAKDFPVIDDEKGRKMQEKILEAKNDLDSVGGIIECAVTGMPQGIGEPMFDGIENRLSTNIFGIPAVKGIEFGAGFGITQMRGSQSNDEFYIDGEQILTKTNNHGGILGGMTSGMPIIFRVAVKPTPSIARPQNTVNLETKENSVLEIHGRHDPSIVLRAVPVVEAVAAITMLDFLI